MSETDVNVFNQFYIFADFVFVVQWIECQIPVLMMGVRIPSRTHFTQC